MMIVHLGFVIWMPKNVLPRRVKIIALMNLRRTWIVVIHRRQDAYRVKKLATRVQVMVMPIPHLGLYVISNLLSR
jgi:hypothetical protein